MKVQIMCCEQSSGRYGNWAQAEDPCGRCNFA